MHRFFAHVKTAPGSACSLRCCGNKFANRILRNGAGHRDSRVLPKMRRYVRHAETQAIRKEIEDGIQEIALEQQAERYGRDVDVLIAAMLEAGFVITEVRR